MKSTRAEASLKGIASINYSAITEAYRNFKFECEQCHNKVILHLTILLLSIINNHPRYDRIHQKLSPIPKVEI